MIEKHDVIAMVQAAIPDADVTVIDNRGTKDHLQVHVISSAFAGKPPMEKHRMVQKSLDDAMKDGRIHALEIKTSTP